MNVRFVHLRRPPVSTKHCRPRGTRGSFLIVAMLICAVIGISLASYINLGRSSLTTSNRSLYNNAAMNLAENGLEEAMYSINKLVADSTYSFTGDGWTAVSGTDNMKRKWSGDAASTYYDSSLVFDQNARGELRVYIYNYNGVAAPVIIARAMVTLGGQASADVEKWVRVQLRKASKFANGLVAKETINFNGSPQVDSWNSKRYPSTTLDTDGDGTLDAWDSDADGDGVLDPLVAYDSSSRNDAGSVGSISVGVSSVLVDNADIWGYVGTGGSPPVVGSTGTIGPFGTSTGTVDASHVSTDFTADFDAVTTPTTAGITNLATINSDLDLPRAGDSPAADGYFYYDAAQINTNNKTLFIKKRATDTTSPKVILRLSNTGTSISIGGSGAIDIEYGSELQIYAAGTISIAGNGITNGGNTSGSMNQPVACQIWGTKTSGTQDIAIKGNGVLSAIVYAPQGDISLDGGVDVYGSVVGNEIVLNGTTAKFHYDESLGNFGGNNPYRVTSWNELNLASDRATYSSVMTW